MTQKPTHFPVLKKEVCQHWLNSPTGFYIDCTFGQGGHSKALLNLLSPAASLLGIDIDPDCSEDGLQLSQEDSRFRFQNLNYSSLYNYWVKQKLPKASGVLFDLGFSTAQLQDPKRSFSYNSSSSSLELRYGLDGKSVYEILNEYSEHKLNWIFKHYGNLREYKELTQAILRERKKEPITSIEQLKAILTNNKVFQKNRYNKNQIKLLFQALRIEANNELENLRHTLEKVKEILEVGGKLLIITFQSLEDELIEDWKRKYSYSIKIPDIGETIPPLFQLHPDSPILPSREEIELNWASRSSKLWVFTKLRE
ncbi:16S rRNA (cytosine(1402)-N(4))-methyltransferase [Mycoplasma wenyonii]|uniref:Ribosomal RNA small subunit methyltransferase H n=1 Tax=Mycoplasma wenyonii TaxID=65123 RepID=A0A328PJZ9_9MOLU|nr:16S rRNA (cytosine(1402)-N(4))-methyltransferase RsmH [Mycoplasma wenyonii]RAO95162.1 16S rRNA (cytosine(1402)-N(4))-methyltransferase [Mycoplasma wenyonii]